jgi:hypothetical protein
VSGGCAGQIYGQGGGGGAAPGGFTPGGWGSGETRRMARVEGVGWAARGMQPWGMGWIWLLPPRMSRRVTREGELLSCVEVAYLLGLHIDVF